MQALKDWIWNLLFLDFYLDKHWSLQFKLLNLISGDSLRVILTALHNHLGEHGCSGCPCGECPGNLNVRRAKYWVDQAWSLYRTGRRV